MGCAFVGLFWLLFGSIGGRIWISKGGSAVVGWIGGILLGPFAFLMLLATPDSRACPHCRSAIPKDATVCAKCARDVPPLG